MKHFEGQQPAESQEGVEVHSLREDIQTDPHLSERARRDFLKFADELEQVNSVLEQGGLSAVERRKN